MRNVHRKEKEKSILLKCGPASRSEDPSCLLLCSRSCTAVNVIYVMMQPEEIIRSADTRLYLMHQSVQLGQNTKEKSISPRLVRLYIFS